MHNQKLMEVKQPLGHHHPLGLKHHPSQSNDRLLRNKSLSFLSLSNFYSTVFSSSLPQADFSSSDQIYAAEMLPDNSAIDSSFGQQINQHCRPDRVNHRNALSSSTWAASTANKSSNQDDCGNKIDTIERKILSSDTQASNFDESPCQQKLDLTQATQFEDLNSSPKKIPLRQEIKNYLSDESIGQQNPELTVAGIQNSHKDYLQKTNSLQSLSNDEIPQFTHSNQTNLAERSYQFSKLASNSPNASPAQPQLIEPRENNVLSQKPDLENSLDLISGTTENEIYQPSRMQESRSSENFRSCNFPTEDNTNLDLASQEEEKEDFSLYSIEPSSEKPNEEKNSNSYKNIDSFKKLSLQRKIENYFQLPSPSKSSATTSQNTALITSDKRDLMGEIPSSQESIIANQTERAVGNSFKPVATQRNPVDPERSEKTYMQAGLKSENGKTRKEDIGKSEISCLSLEGDLNLLKEADDSNSLKLTENSSPTLFSELRHIPGSQNSDPLYGKETVSEYLGQKASPPTIQRKVFLPTQGTLGNQQMPSLSYEAPVEWSNLQDLVVQGSKFSPEISKIRRSPESKLDLALNPLLRYKNEPNLADEPINNFQEAETNELINLSFASPSPQTPSGLSPLAIPTNLIEGTKLESQVERESDIPTHWTGLESLIDQVDSISQTSLSEQPVQHSKIENQKKVKQKEVVQAKSIAPLSETLSLVQKFTNMPKAEGYPIQRQPESNHSLTSIPPPQILGNDSYVAVSANAPKEALSRAQSIELLAQEMYALLRQRLSIEQERHGGS